VRRSCAIVRRIRYLGDPVLRKKAERVGRVTEEIRRLVAEMFETMASARGIGLAAPQVGVSRRVIVADVPRDEGDSDRIALINPEIVSLAPERECMDEGCLSIPGLSAPVERPVGAVIRGLDMKGRKVTIRAEGLFARCLLHEIDHLEGVLFNEHAGISDARATRAMILPEGDEGSNGKATRHAASL
jgi:peptide deformylase